MQIYEAVFEIVLSGSLISNWATKLDANLGPQKAKLAIRWDKTSHGREGKLDISLR